MNINRASCVSVAHSSCAGRKHLVDDSPSKYRLALNHQHDELVSSIVQARDLISHSGEKGAEIEQKIRDSLSQVLPERIGISHGFVVDSAGNESKQMDVVLYDKMNAPKIYTSQRVQIFPVESVYVCGEVKTKLDRTSLSDSFEKCLSFKNLSRTAYDTTFVRNESEIRRPRDSFFFTAAYQSTELKDLHENVIRPYHEKLARHKGIDTVVVLNNSSEAKNIMINHLSNPDGSVGLVSFCSLDSSSTAVYRARKSWAMFVGLLLKLIVVIPSPTIDMLPYHGDEPF